MITLSKKAVSHWNLKLYMPAILAVICLIIIGRSVNSGFLSVGNVGNILTLTGILAIAVIAQTLVILSGGEGIDMSVGAVMSMGALFGPMLTGGESSKLVIATVIIMVMGALIGMINGIGIQAFKVPPLIMTLIMASVINGFALAYTSGQPVLSIPQALLNVSKPIIGPIAWLPILTLVILIIMELILGKSRYGHMLYLTGSNRRAARLCGINVNFVVVGTYMLVGLIGMVAGLVLVGYAGSAQMEMANDYTLLSIAAAVIGGTKLTGGEGTLVGGIFGSLVLVILTSVLVVLGVGAGVRECIQGVVLMVILVLYSRAPRLRQ